MTQSRDPGIKHARIAPLPGPSLVIDVRNSGDNMQLLKYLQTMVQDLARALRTTHVSPWDQLSDFVDFLALETEQKDIYQELLNSHGNSNPTGKQETLDEKGNYIIKKRNGQEPLIIEGKEPLCTYIGNTVTRVRKKRNGAEKAPQVSDNQPVPEQSVVHVLFVIDMKRETTLWHAATYANWLKEWNINQFGEPRSGRTPQIKTIGICLNVVPHLHYPLLSDDQNRSLDGFDSLLLLPKYDEDESDVGENTQRYRAELLLYTLLLHWPACLEPEIEDPIVPATPAAHVLRRPTYLVGLAALEHSGRWGSRWLYYRMAGDLAKLLSTSPSTQQEQEDTHHQRINIWFKEWQEDVAKVVKNSVSSILPKFEAIKELTTMVQDEHAHTLLASSTRLSGIYGNTRYNGSEIMKIQTALDNAPTAYEELRKIATLAKRSGHSDDNADQAYQKLTALCNEAQQYLQNFFRSASGALPRAQGQLILFRTYINRLHKTIHSLPDLESYRSQIEQMTEKVQMSKEQSQVHIFPWQRKTHMREMQQIQADLRALIQDHLTHINAILVAKIALSLLQKTAIYPSSDEGSPDQKRIQFIRQGLIKSFQDAEDGWAMAEELRRRSTSRYINDLEDYNLSNRRELLQWNMLVDAYTQWEQDSAEIQLLARALLQQPGTNETPLTQMPEEIYNDAKELFPYTQLTASLLAAQTGGITLASLESFLGSSKLVVATTSAFLDMQAVRQENRAIILQPNLSERSIKNRNPGFTPASILADWSANLVKEVSDKAHILAPDSFITHLANPKNHASIANIVSHVKLGGYPNKASGTDYHYLFLPAVDSVKPVYSYIVSELQINSLQQVPLPDLERLIYLRLHRLRQVEES